MAAVSLTPRPAIITSIIFQIRFPKLAARFPGPAPCLLHPLVTRRAGADVTWCPGRRGPGTLCRKGQKAAQQKAPGRILAAGSRQGTGRAASGRTASHREQRRHHRAHKATRLSSSTETSKYIYRTTLYVDRYKIHCQILSIIIICW